MKTHHKRTSLELRRLQKEVSMMSYLKTSFHKFFNKEQLKLLTK